jgi:hypothetical protein
MSSEDDIAELDRALLGKAQRLGAEATGFSAGNGPANRLLALSLRDQLRVLLADLKANCTSIATEISAAQLRRIAAQAYRARGAAPLNGRN